MDGTIGEIRLFSGNFAPKNWALCVGTACKISELQALFSILGTNFGGDGRVTFNLPDLRGRIPIGAGMGHGLSNRILGQQLGTEDVTLDISQLANHDHVAVLAPPGYSGKVKPKALNGKGTQVSDPTDAYMADSPSGKEIYSSTTNTEMGESDVTITESTAGAVSVNPAGGSQPHNNMQPAMALNYIICTTGLYPARN